MMENNNTLKGEESESSLAAVFELPGEPAIVINGLPPLTPNENTFVPCRVASAAESRGRAGFGQWLEGRHVYKLFGDQFYSGRVAEFDKETGWYKVVYEDGDVEDLEWRELEQILAPLDITVPLKALALKIIKKKQKSVHSSSGKTAGRPRNDTSKSIRGNIKTVEVHEEGSSGKLNRVTYKFET